MSDITDDLLSKLYDFTYFMEEEKREGFRKLIAHYEATKTLVTAVSVYQDKPTTGNMFGMFESLPLELTRPNQ